MDEKEEKKMSFSEALSYAKGDVVDFKEKLKNYSYDFDKIDETGVNYIQNKNKSFVFKKLIMMFR